MAQANTTTKVVTVPQLAALDVQTQQAWDLCAGNDNPFVRFAFLNALERTGCVGTQRGWSPCHQLVYIGDRLVAAIPMYLRSDSYGEFIFDWAWAAAAEQNHISYYPKLVVAIPYTPAAGPRILCAPGVSLDAVLAVWMPALQQLERATKASGVHVLFARPQEVEALARHGFVARQSYQFHLTAPPEWQHFDDYLAALRAPSRKQVRKERARAQSHGLEISFLPANARSAADLAALYAFYRQTVWEKGAHAYMTEHFFAELGALASDTVYVAMAHKEGRPVAAALFLRGGPNLFGRYWGAQAAFDALHFELCYYLPVQWGLAHGIRHFEAGAQGLHKLKRGFLPAPCYSAHRLRHKGLMGAVRQYCDQEATAVAQEVAALSLHTPFGRQQVDLPPACP